MSKINLLLTLNKQDRSFKLEPVDVQGKDRVAVLNELNESSWCKISDNKIVVAMEEEIASNRVAAQVRLLGAISEAWPEFAKRKSRCFTCNRPEAAEARAELEDGREQLVEHLYGRGPRPAEPRPPMHDEHGFLVPQNCCRRKAQ